MSELIQEPLKLNYEDASIIVTIIFRSSDSVNYTYDSLQKAHQTNGRSATYLDNTTKFLNPSKQGYQSTTMESLPVTVSDAKNVCSSILYSSVELN